nr:MAG: acid phosphatase [Bacteriophage sp.]
MNRKTVIVWDLDGTLRDGRHRLHLLPTGDYSNPDSWLPFNMACGGDSPIWDNIELLRSQAMAGYHIVLLTFCDDRAMQQTKEWLARHYIPYNRLIMRDIDGGTDVDFKEQRLRSIGVNNILCMFDDSEHVVKHVRRMGITCHQVTHYEESEKHAHLKSSEELSHE